MYKAGKSLARQGKALLRAQIFRIFAVRYHHRDFVGDAAVKIVPALSRRGEGVYDSGETARRLGTQRPFQALVTQPHPR